MVVLVQKKKAQDINGRKALYTKSSDPFRLMLLRARETEISTGAVGHFDTAALHI